MESTAIVGETSEQEVVGQKRKRVLEWWMLLIKDVNMLGVMVSKILNYHPQHVHIFFLTRPI